MSLPTGKTGWVGSLNRPRAIRRAAVTGARKSGSRGNGGWVSYSCIADHSATPRGLGERADAQLALNGNVEPFEQEGQLDSLIRSTPPAAEIGTFVNQSFCMN